MDAYEKEMYLFLSRPDNFRNMLRVMDQYEMVRKELIREFWLEVKKQLKEKIEGSDWLIVDNWHPEFHGNWGFFLTKPTWKIGEHIILALCWEGLGGHPSFGTFINQAQKIAGYSEIYNSTRGLSASEGFKKDRNEWWPFWQWGPTNLDDRNQLERILPDNREGTALEHAELILDLAEKVEPHYDEMAERHLPKS
jgi:hypothetical protein